MTNARGTNALQANDLKWHYVIDVTVTNEMSNGGFNSGGGINRSSNRAVSQLLHHASPDSSDFRFLVPS